MSLETSTLPPPLLLQLRTAMAHAKKYILGRRSENGGFCFYKTESVDEPNLHDTYHAVAALTLLDADVPAKDQQVRFLDDFPLWGLNYLYYYAFTLGLLGRTSLITTQRLALIQGLTIPPPPPMRSDSIRMWLETVFMTVRLKRRFTEHWKCPDVARFLQGLKTSGGYGVKPNLWDTYLSLSILSLLGEQFAMPDTQLFINQRQVPSLGFSLSDGSLMYDLDVMYAGVKCCEILGSQISFSTDILHRVMSCQAADGGFSRSPVALPDLELTHKALQIIAIIAPETLSMPNQRIEL